MNSASVRQFAVALFCVLSGPLLSAQTNAPISTSASTVKSASLTPVVRANYAHLPLSFEKNTGQTAPNVQWLARGPESMLFLSGNDATVEIHHIDKVKRDGVELPQVHSTSLRMSLLHSQPAQSSIGEQMQSGHANYFTGKDSSRWQKDVPLYGQVRLNEVYPGVSLLYHGERGQLEYDFVVAPEADPARIALGFTGSTPSVADNGDLLLPVSGEPTVRFDKPVVYQVKDGVHTHVDASYLIAKDGHVGFQLGSYDHTRELVIDPKLVFLGTLGTGNYPVDNTVSQMTVDSTGTMYFIGTTNDPTYPITPGAYQKVCGPANSTAAANGIKYCPPGGFGDTSAYISKISADGTTLVYSTYLSGGGGYEQGASIAVDSAGVAYLLGATASSDFPITSDAFQKLCQPASNPVLGPPVKPPVAQCNNFANGGGTEYTINGPVFFYAKLSADGSTLIYSSFLGGSASAFPIATALDASGNWYLYGQTNVYNPQHLYLGSNGPGDNVQFPGISQNAYLASSSVGGQPNPQDINVAAVLSKFSNDGKTLLYGTFFGDDVNNVNFYPTSMAVGANGVAFIGGYTSASAIPTTSGVVKGSCTVAVSSTYNGVTSFPTCSTADGIVAAFDTNKGALVYSTRVGGSAAAQGSNIPNQELLGLAADAKNNAYVTGYTYDQTFPVPKSGYLNSCNVANPNNVNNCDTAFVLELNPTGTAILGGSFLNGPPAYYESSVGYKVAVDSKNQIYLYGISGDGYNSFPLVNPVQGYSNNSELYIAAISSDLTKLLFSTRIGNPSLTGSNVTPVNGLALDAASNIYFAGTTADPNFAATPGAYATAANSGGSYHTLFGKISPVLPIGATALTITPPTTTTGQAIAFNVTVSGVANGAVPTGSVAVSYTTPGNTKPTLFETLQLDSSGMSTFTSTSLAAGSYTFTGVYSGDTNYDVGTSSPVSLTINTPATATLRLSSSGSSVIVGATVTFTATVSAATGTPTGTITFQNGTTTLGTAPLNGSGVATYSTSFSKSGSYNITASYGGDTMFGTAVSSAVTEVVTTPIPSVTLASSAAKATTGYNVTFTASVTGTGAVAPTGTVTFLDGTTTLGTGTISSGVATFSTASLAAGTHSITASYGGDSNYGTAVSAVFTETIVTASFTVTYNPTPVVIQRGSSGTTTMTITPNEPYTGTLTFGCNGASASITCSFTPTTLTWGANNGTTVQTSVITIQTTAPHLVTKVAGLGAGTLLGGLTAAFALLPFARRRKLGLVGRRLALLIVVIACTGAIASLSGCSGGSSTPAPVGGTPTGAQSLSITFNGADNAAPLNITVQ